MKLPIYMDNHATTPVDPRVLDAMLPFLAENFGNASSKHHAFGWRAEEAVDAARDEVARAIGASEKEIVFTSGATESNNLAIKGVAAQAREKGRRIVTAVTEHKAVIDPLKRLEKEGVDVVWLAVDGDGRISLDDLRAAVTPQTILITLMAANNEIGVLHPLAEIGRLAKERGVLFHTDATQAVGKIAIDVESMGIDLLSLSAHKMYGPKGVGALYVRRREPRVRLAPMLEGGGQERGLRSGTLNVPGIVALGAACRISSEMMPDEGPRLARLRDRLYAGICARLDGVYLNGSLDARLPNNLNLSFACVEGESMLMAMDDVAVSSGSACTSASLEPSHVLRALGRGNELAHSSVRFGLGRFNTEQETDYVIEKIATVVTRLREMSPLYEPDAERARGAGGVLPGRAATGITESPQGVS
ncbi:MAG: IscS subfamily cysteine desulfurase [bacterium]